MTGPVATLKVEHPSRWVRALLDPVPLAISPSDEEAGELERGFALLIDARHVLFQREGPRFGWPDLGSWPGSEAPAGARLVGATGELLSGVATSTTHLESLSRDQDADLPIRSVAGVLAAIAIRDAGRPDLALEMLRRIQPSDDFEEALVLIHVGLAFRESGDPEAALRASLEAAKLVPRRARRTRIGEALFAIASRNALSFAFAANKRDVVNDLNRVYMADLLSELESRASEGLSSFVTQEFNARFEDPGASSLSYRQEDPIQTPLAAVRMRAEVLGDWNATQKSRSRLGQYQLLASLGVPDRQPGSALHLLRRADDSRAVEKAISSYLFDGPLQPIRDFAREVVSIAWSPITVRSDLSTLAVAADVMEPITARAALQRILETFESLMSGVPGARLDEAVLRAVAALLPVGREPSWVGDNSVASAFWHISAESQDALLLQTMARVIRAIDWSLVSAETLESWERYCSNHLRNVDDHRFVATTLLRTLPMTNSLRGAATDGFRVHPDLLSAVNLLAIGDTRRGDLTAAARLLRDDLRAAILASMEGKHSIGSIIDSPTALLELLLDHPGEAGWRDLVRYLKTPTMAGARKASLLDRLVARREDLPFSVSTKIARWLSGSVQFVDLPLESPDEIRGAVLRARMSFHSRSVDVLVGEFAELAASPQRTARLEAARSLEVAASFLPSEVVLIQCLGLTRDPAVEVRSVAARSLAALAPDQDDPLATASWRRLAELLHDPGAIVAGWVLGGLLSATQREWPAEIAAAVVDLATAHPAYRVRAAAARVLEGLGARGGESLPKQGRTTIAHVAPPPLA